MAEVSIHIGTYTREFIMNTITTRFDATDVAGRDSTRSEVCHCCRETVQLFDPSTMRFGVCWDSTTDKGWICYPCLNVRKAEKKAAALKTDKALVAGLTLEQAKQALAQGLLNILANGRAKSIREWDYGWDYDPHLWWARLHQVRGTDALLEGAWQAELRVYGLPVPAGPAIEGFLRGPEQEAHFWAVCSKLTGHALGSPKRILIA